MQQRAFSLPELLVVVAIVGVLTATAVPSYREYVIRSEIASMMKLIKDDLNKAEEYFNYAGLPKSTADITTAEGIVTFTSTQHASIEHADFGDANGLYFRLYGGNLPTGVDIRLRFVTDPTLDSFEWACRYGSATTAVVNTGVTNGDYLLLPSECHTISGSPTWF